MSDDLRQRRVSQTRQASDSALLDRGKEARHANRVHELKKELSDKAAALKKKDKEVCLHIEFSLLVT